MDEAIENVEKRYTDPVTGKFIPGNPGGGRPKGSLSITALVKAELEKVPEGQQITYAQALIKKLLHKAIIEGDTQTQKIIWNYIDGMPQQFMDHTTAGQPFIEISETIAKKNGLNQRPEPNSL